MYLKSERQLTFEYLVRSIFKTYFNLTTFERTTLLTSYVVLVKHDQLKYTRRGLQKNFNSK